MNKLQINDRILIKIQGKKKATAKCLFLKEKKGIE